MKKMDLIKETKPLYSPSAKKVSLVDVPEFTYLMIDGAGNPNTAQSFRDAMESLFSVAYTAKFTIKKSAPDNDYRVMPLQCLWWTQDGSKLADADKDSWKWTAMILQPPIVTAEVIRSAIQQVANKKNPASIHALRLERFAEGRCAQILHIGPFSEEGPTVDQLHRHLADIGATPRGRHHEIYLSDTRRAAPSNWKTNIRQPYSI